MEMAELVLHDVTRRQLQGFTEHPVHALLLVGPDGIGKASVAQALLASLLGCSAGKLATHPYVLHITPEGDSISIDTIRRLQKFLQLKTLGSHPLRRAILIEHAQALTTEAQNAYLKLLEEPPADTIMILTATSPHALLPTILSRLQTIAIQVPTVAQLTPLLEASAQDEAAQRQTYFLSGGLPGLLTALLQDDQAHPLVEAVGAAKDMFRKTPFERLTFVDSLSKQKEQLRAMLEALQRIAQAGLAQAIDKQDTKRVAQWHSIRKQTLQTKEMIDRSANAKLALSNLFLHL